VDIGWAGWVRFDLVAQVADIDPQNVKVFIAFSPHLTQQLAVGDHFPGRDNERPQSITAATRRAISSVLHSRMPHPALSIYLK